MNRDEDGVQASRGEKTIEVQIRFWTNNIAETEDQIRPKHCWSSGTVRVPQNNLHGISSGGSQTFNSLMELTSAIEQAMIDAGIRMHTGRKQDFYVQS